MNSLADENRMLSWGSNPIDEDCLDTFNKMRKLGLGGDLPEFEPMYDIVEKQFVHKRFIIYQKIVKDDSLVFDGFIKEVASEPAIFKLLPVVSKNKEEYRRMVTTIQKLQGHINLPNQKRNFFIVIKSDQHSIYPGKYLCIALEKFGKSLEDMRGILTIRQCQEIVLEMLKVIDYIHKKDVSHNAISERKFLISIEGSISVKLLFSWKTRDGTENQSKDIFDFGTFLKNAVEWCRNGLPGCEKSLIDDLSIQLTAGKLRAYPATYHPYLWTSGRKLEFMAFYGDYFDKREDPDINKQLENAMKDVVHHNWAEKLQLMPDEKEKWIQNMPDFENLPLYKKNLNERMVTEGIMYAKATEDKNPPRSTRSRSGKTSRPTRPNDAGAKFPVQSKVSEKDKEKKYDSASGLSFIRFIRNMDTHLLRDCDKLTKNDPKLQTLFACKDDIWHFIARRFPLLMLKLHMFTCENRELLAKCEIEGFYLKSQ